MRHWHGDELHRFSTVLPDPEPIHVHFRPHRWSWASCAVGFSCAAAFICGMQWLALRDPQWGFGFLAALLAAPALWIVCKVERAE